MAGRDHFATTHWSMVQAAIVAGPSPESREALAALCEAYWYPLYAFLRSRGASRDDAEDMTQAFFARVLEKNGLRHADRTKGRFRAFLLTALKNFSANEYDKTSAKKRGGGVAPLSMEFDTAEGRLQLEPPTSETPEKSFDRRWAVTLLDRVLARIRSEMSAAGKQAQFNALSTYLAGDRARTYAKTAAELSMSEAAVKVAVHRLRRRYRDVLREEISHTVSTAVDIDDELRYLWSAVSR
jgi:RNA polymerase sigma-70 factor (ECF subfamily)